MAIKALIFDVDGTLCETEEAHRTAFNDVFAARGLGWHWSAEEYEALLAVTGGKERMLAWRHRLGHTLPSETEIAEMHRAKTARYAEILACGGLAARPGVSALVAEARSAGLRLAIATTTSPTNVDGLCHALWGLPAGTVFDVIAAGDEVAAKKPAPDVYHLALDRLGLAATEAIAFEDSRNGLIAAQSAGLRVVVTPSAFTRGDDLRGATVMLPDLEGVTLAAILDAVD